MVGWPGLISILDRNGVEGPIGGASAGSPGISLLSNLKTRAWSRWPRMCTAGGWPSSAEQSMTTVQDPPLTLGDGRHRAGQSGILAFVLDGYRPEDVGSALNAGGIAVRAGHH